MADEKLLPGFEDEPVPGNHPRFWGDAEDVIPIGLPLGPPRDDLTPEERAQNKAHDEALAKAHKEASEIPDDD